MESSVPEDSQRATGGGAPGSPGAPTNPHGDHDAAGAPGNHQPPGPADSDPHGDRPPSPPGRFVRRVRRSGGGGRWWLWMGRAVLWAFILVVVFNGIRAPLARVLEPETSATTADAQADYPTSAASAYALQFAHAYLTYAKGDSTERSELLAEYLPPAADPQLGWNGEGSLELESAQIADVAVRDSEHGTVTLSVQVGGEWMRLAVPVYADGEAMVISGQPALLPPPPRAQLPAPAEQALDQAAASELRSQLPGFFQAYASSDAESLARYLAPGVSMAGFSGAVTFRSLDEVAVPAGSGATRRVTATVTWALPAAADTAEGELQQTYQLTATKQDGRWYVKDIRGAPSEGFS